jgi:hypothetical protein
LHRKIRLLWIVAHRFSMRATMRHPWVTTRGDSWRESEAGAAPQLEQGSNWPPDCGAVGEQAAAAPGHTPHPR